MIPVEAISDKSGFGHDSVLDQATLEGDQGVEVQSGTPGVLVLGNQIRTTQVPVEDQSSYDPQNRVALRANLSKAQ